MRPNGPVAVAVVLLSSTTLANAASFTCEVAYTADLMTGGAPGDSSVQRMFVAVHPRMSFVVEGSLVRVFWQTRDGVLHPATPPTLQRHGLGGSLNDWTAYRAVDCGASCPLSMLRIRTWEKPL